MDPLFEAQLLTYLKISQLWLGILLNFNVPVMKYGIKRIVNG
jgi:GxxExxY protein